MGSLILNGLADKSAVNLLVCFPGWIGKHPAEGRGSALVRSGIDHHALLSRRERLFSPDPRLGWVFRDRWWFLRPFPEAPPQQRSRKTQPRRGSGLNLSLIHI